MDQTPRKVLFISSEVAPFAKTGGLADVAGALPVALAEQGIEVRVIMPRYGEIDAVKSRFKASTRWIELPIGDEIVKAALFQATLPDSSVPIYFVSYEPYFERPGLYGEGGCDYQDNLERFTLFSQVALKRIRPDGWVPDVIHCNDWQTGLIPALVAARRGGSPTMRNIKTLFTIHNIAYQGNFPAAKLPITGLEPWQYGMDGVEYYGQMSLLKAGIVYSDWITTVSPTYAREIQTAEQGGGMDGLLRHLGARLSGVLNGVDYAKWDPSVDTLIAKNYSPRDLCGKAACKRELQSECRLPLDPDVPVLALITRLVDQKGLDLLTETIDDLLRLPVQFVVLGEGDPAYERFFRTLQENRPDQVAAMITFDEVMAHKIEAGADIFLMPSRYEPCGLNQMYSLRYGTVPVVRRTGGLADTVLDFDERTGEGTGFVFSEYAAYDFFRTVMRALALYWGGRDGWMRLQESGMRQDFSWARAATTYIDLYNRICAP